MGVGAVSSALPVHLARGQAVVASSSLATEASLPPFAWHMMCLLTLYLAKNKRRDPDEKGAVVRHGLPRPE